MKYIKAQLTVESLYSELTAAALIIWLVPISHRVLNFLYGAAAYEKYRF